MQRLLNTSNLSIGFQTNKNREVILHQDINLELRSSEITCLLGPNGSGKSTLIRTLCGLQRPLAGFVEINGKLVEKMLPGDLSRLVSIVLTGELEISNINVFSMVAYGRSPYTGYFGKLNDNDVKIVESAMQSTGIEHLSHQKFETLSDGEKQKVMIAKSLAQETPLILLDEPTAFLDFPGKVEIMQLLRNTAREHQKAVLLSTHDINLAIQFADRLWLMARERPIVTGMPEDLVLKGEIGSFFDKRKIRFEAETGTFIFETVFRGKVYLAGAGTTYDWMAKALKRKGFEIIDPDDTQGEATRINVGKGKFELIAQGKILQYNTIEEVLQQLETNQ